MNLFHHNLYHLPAAQQQQQQRSEVCYFVPENCLQQPANVILSNEIFEATLAIQQKIENLQLLKMQLSRKQSEMLNSQQRGDPSNYNFVDNQFPHNSAQHVQTVPDDTSSFIPSPQQLQIQQRTISSFPSMLPFPMNGNMSRMMIMPTIPISGFSRQNQLMTPMNHYLYEASLQQQQLQQKQQYQQQQLLNQQNQTAFAQMIPVKFEQDGESSQSPTGSQEQQKASLKRHSSSALAEASKERLVQKRICTENSKNNYLPQPLQQSLRISLPPSYNQTDSPTCYQKSRSTESLSMTQQLHAHQNSNEKLTIPNQMKTSLSPLKLITTATVREHISAGISNIRVKQEDVFLTYPMLQPPVAIAQQPSESERRKKETQNDSNYTKNLIKGFRRYMGRRLNGQKDKVDKFTQYFYNNSLSNEFVILLLENSPYCEEFADFLSEDPMWWIQEAKIKDGVKQMKFFQIVQERKFTLIRTKRKTSRSVLAQINAAAAAAAATPAQVAICKIMQ